jgi:hypothetical protein
LLNKFNERLWRLTRHVLEADAEFNGAEYSFTLTRNPFPGEIIHPGPYRLGKHVDDANTYRIGHPLAQRILDLAKALPVPSAEVVFDYTKGRKNIAVLTPLVGRSGWLSCACLTVQSLDTEESILFTGIMDDGTVLDDIQCCRMFDLEGAQGDSIESTHDIQSRLQNGIAGKQSEQLAAIAAKNGTWFDTEMEKLDHWADDLKAGIEREIKDLELEIGAMKKQARQAATLDQKIAGQKQVKDAERRLKDNRKRRDEAQDEIETRKDALIEEVEAQLRQQTKVNELFTVRWAVV